MHRFDIRTAEQALAYITDCNLATVSTMAMTKSRRKAEYQRQQDIAQSAIDWMDSFGVIYAEYRDIGGMSPSKRRGRYIPRVGLPASPFLLNVAAGREVFSRAVETLSCPTCQPKIPSDNECMICGSLILEGLMVCSSCEGSDNEY